MAISQQHAQELADYYEQELKPRVRAVNDKYSLTEHEVNLNFPESLGLEKLSFTPRTEEEIAAQSEAAAQEKCATRQASIEKALSSALANLAQQQISADESHRQKVGQLAADYAKNCKDFRHRAVNVNLLYSTIYENVMRDFLDSHNAALTEQTARYQAQNDAFAKKEEDSRTIYEQQLALLQQQREVIRQNIAETLRQKDEKQALAVQKYNNEVDEKENKYKYNCERATDAARRAESSRALAAARIYAQIGETAMEQRKKTEKLYAAMNALGRFSREEGLFILDLDAFLITELQEYYSTLEDFVNNHLK